MKKEERKAHHPREATLASKNRGITLISLVITIIILLILAGVTISLTLGENGIFELAEKAGKNYMDAQNNEIAQLQNYNNTINEIVRDTTINDIKSLQIEAFDKKTCGSNGTTAVELTLQVNKNIKKAILIYSVGTGDSKNDANAKTRETTVKCSSNSNFKCSCLSSNCDTQKGGTYSGSALQEIYVLENLKANDIIIVEGYSKWGGVRMATLISCEM